MICLFFISFHCAQLFYCPPPPYRCFHPPWFLIFEHWTADVKKNINPISPDYQKDVKLFKIGRGRRDETLNSQDIPEKSSSSHHDKVIFQFIVCYYEPPKQNSKPFPMLLIGRWACLYPGQQTQVRISLEPI